MGLVAKYGLNINVQKITFTYLLKLIQLFALHEMWIYCLTHALTQCVISFGWFLDLVKIFKSLFKFVCHLVMSKMLNAFVVLLTDSMQISMAKLPIVRCKSVELAKS
jgi:hypothetical protein